MSRRNMSERANCGLMLCEGVTVAGSLGTPRPFISSPKTQDSTKITINGQSIELSSEDQKKLKEGLLNIGKTVLVNTPVGIVRESVNPMVNMRDQAVQKGIKMLVDVLERNGSKNVEKDLENLLREKDIPQPMREQAEAWLKNNSQPVAANPSPTLEKPRSIGTY